jgi:hypothetical protein
MNFKNLRYLYLFGCLVVFGCKQPGAKNAVKVKPENADTAFKKLTVKSMHDDLNILWSAIKEMHPAYGIYTSADSLQSAYDKAYASINEPMYESGFIDHVYPFLCKLRCGHTQLRFSEGNKEPKALKSSALPFEVLVRNHKAWVTTHKTNALNTGDEIIKMNGVPVAQIINHGYNLYCADGYGETFSELFLSEYDGFEDACNKYYHWTAPYNITLKTQQGVLKTISVDQPAAGSKPPSPSKQVDNYADWTIAKNTDYLPLRFLKNSSTAWFEVKSYQYNDTVIFKEAFKQIHEKDIKNLIIDLRHNTGGDIRIAAKLLSYLASSPYHIIGDVKSRVPNPAVNSFEKYFDTARTASFKEGFTPAGKEGAYYHVDFKSAFGDMLAILPLNKTAHFNGRLIVLIDGATFSAGAHSAATIKTYCKGVKFIGRETAGAEEGCSGGTIQHLTLPNTRVLVEFPWMRFVSVAKHPVFGRGIMPDYPVIYAPQDVVTKNDPDIKKALTLIN